MPQTETDAQIRNLLLTAPRVAFGTASDPIWTTEASVVCRRRVLEECTRALGAAGLSNFQRLAILHALSDPALWYNPPQHAIKLLRDAPAAWPEVAGLLSENTLVNSFLYRASDAFEDYAERLTDIANG